MVEIDEVIRRLSLAADHIIAWANKNNLEINVNKTKAIPFGSTPFIRDLPLVAQSYIEIGSSRVHFESFAKSLGVVLDSTLTWKDHVTMVSKKAHSLMYSLHFFRSSTNFRLRKHLIEMLLFPLVDYCSLVFTNMSDEQESRLDKLINSGIRYVFGVNRFEHITPYRRELSWLRVKMRRAYFLSCSLFKLFRSSRPLYLASEFTFNNSVRPVRAANVRPLVIPRFRTETLRNSYSILGSYIWNHFPPELRQLNTISSFKKSSFSYFFNIDCLIKIPPNWFSLPSLTSHL